MKKITQKQYDDMLNVLPPLEFEVNNVIDFLTKMDKNPELVKKIRNLKPIDAFMQGEGFDNHTVYVQNKSGCYIVGKTRIVWNTEMFRYNDWRTMSHAEIKRYNMW